MSAPLMPKATALWLVENTPLTFQQIADFCHLHVLEVQAIADGEIGYGLQPFDPVAHRQITPENLEACIKNPKASLVLIEMPEMKPRKKTKKYVPLAQRKNKPNAIAWLVKHYSGLSDQQIIDLIGTTRNTIESIRERVKHKDEGLEPKNPVLLGVCSQTALNDLLATLSSEKESKERRTEKKETSSFLETDASKPETQKEDLEESGDSGRDAETAH